MSCDILFFLGSLGLCPLDWQQWSALMAVRVSWWHVWSCSKRWHGAGRELPLHLAPWASRGQRLRPRLGRSYAEQTSSRAPSKPHQDGRGLSPTGAPVLRQDPELGPSVGAELVVSPPSTPHSATTLTLPLLVSVQWWG